MVKRSGGALMHSVRVDPQSNRPLAAQIANSIRNLILDGSIRPGMRLPATRTLAYELGVSRTTMVDVFERLLAEDLVEARVGAGTFVKRIQGGIGAASTSGLTATSDSGEAGGDHRRMHAGPPPATLSAPPRPLLPSFARRLSHDNVAFATALPALDMFPVARWSRLTTKHLRDPRESALGYSDNAGFLPLRRAIVSHLRTARGINCNERQVFIVNGAQEAFNIIASTLLESGNKVWFENPGAIGARNAFNAVNAELVAVPVDREGMVVEHGHRIAPDFQMAFVTPSHQQPLTAVMSLARRFQLLAAAESAGAWIVEYDCDGEFHYGGQPLPAIKSADRDNVLYVGSFGETLFPSLRLGYLVAPEQLVDLFAEIFNAYLPGASLGAQAAVAAFMEDGHFAMHVRRMRGIYQERHDALIEAGERFFGEMLALQQVESGLDTVGYLPPCLDENLVAERVKEHGVTVVPFDRYCLQDVTLNGLVLGFSGFTAEQIQAGAKVLAQVLDAMAAETRP